MKFLGVFDQKPAVENFFYLYLPLFAFIYLYWFRTVGCHPSSSAAVTISGLGAGWGPGLSQKPLKRWQETTEEPRIPGWKWRQGRPDRPTAPTAPA